MDRNGRESPPEMLQVLRGLPREFFDFCRPVPVPYVRQGVVREGATVRAADLVISLVRFLGFYGIASWTLTSGSMDDDAFRLLQYTREIFPPREPPAARGGDGRGRQRGGEMGMGEGGAFMRGAGAHPQDMHRGDGYQGEFNEDDEDDGGAWGGELDELEGEFGTGPSTHGGGHEGRRGGRGRGRRSDGRAGQRYQYDLGHDAE